MDFCSSIILKDYLQQPLDKWSWWARFFRRFQWPKMEQQADVNLPKRWWCYIYLFSLIIGKYGWSWLESLAEQNVHCMRGTGTTATLLAAPDSPYIATLTANLNYSKNITSKTPEDPDMRWPQICTAFASTSRPESAKLFLSWLANVQFQQVNAANGDCLVRRDINSTRGIAWNNATTDVTQFQSEHEDIQNIWDQRGSGVERIKVQQG